MAKPTPLQEQLLKAGLVKKSKVAQAAREQLKARHGKGPAEPSDVAREAERARLQKVERDRALERERKTQARQTELRAQARQIIQDKQVSGAGDSDYRFDADGAIRSLLVSNEQRRQLASGALVIARLGERYVLLPRAAGDKVREREPGMVVLDHGNAAGVGDAGAGDAAATSEDDAYYAQFQVPDDLVW